MVASGQPAVQVRHIKVCADRVVFEIDVRPDFPHRTTPDIAHRISAIRPGLSFHACVNRVGQTFGDVIDDTSIIHLIEHVVIDLLVEQLAESEQGPQQPITGTSEWIDACKGTARIAISCTDDLQVLSAFNVAVELVGSVLQDLRYAGHA